ncbi:MAG: selenocysteine-specific translation elongation factor [Spirochaetales bacterium]|uniref:Selenocysteine-specific elongation factor n=1 Tax=Candidatus Thalassospirochaeta sargassi TaxID=3119039 RepID=A0AAJ1ICA0_9SPIO|nr:selenocysteine-specific translation elongation factor [Spirochaetales bacterium]
MHIIGTAGHVDHGKTQLIKALTGIDTDRLPEEKQRGLTIDLGFAHFNDEQGSKIGVVDVPGHERFIRNMTAGAWGIDLALLVVAADDGWMFQTGNHMRVLMAMGINELLIVVTKTDIVEPKRTADVIEDCRLRLLEITGRKYPAIGVSAAAGDNIPELKKLIYRKLAGKEDMIPGKPLMYIDRAFSIQGAGLVVTGSLREGGIKKNDSLLLLPNKKPIRVRGLQTYEDETDEAVPACRLAVNIAGADIEEVGRGCCLTLPDSGFTAETEFIIELNQAESSVRNHSEAEFAAGTAHSIGVIHFLTVAGRTTARARVTLSSAIPLRLGQPIVIIRKGGSLITGSGKIIWKGTLDKNARRAVATAADTDSTSLNLAVHGLFNDGNKWIFQKEKRLQLENDIKAEASSAGGIRREELVGRLKLSAGAVVQLIEGLTGSGEITEQNGLLSTSEKNDIELSRTASQILKEMEQAGDTGFDLSKKRIPGAHKELRVLTRAGLIIPLTETLFLTEKIFSSLCERMLKGLKKGDTFDIAHAKQRTGLSRKYIIPLLNKMEEKKLVSREENLRRVL